MKEPLEASRAKWLYFEDKAFLGEGRTCAKGCALKDRQGSSYTQSRKLALGEEEGSRVKNPRALPRQSVFSGKQRTSKYFHLKMWLDLFLWKVHLAVGVREAIHVPLQFHWPSRAHL